MIKLIYSAGEHKGEICRSWENVQEFCQESINQVSMVAYENKLDQRSVFTHYGYEVITTATGANGFQNGVLASMNFWLDSIPDTIMEYDSGDTQDEREIRFYELVNQIARVPGMLTFRTSNDLWYRYSKLSNTVSEVPLRLWEPTTEHPEQVLKDYPLVGALIEAAGLLANEEKRIYNAGAWAFQELLNGANLEKTVKAMRDVAASVRAKLPDYKYTKAPSEDIFAAIYALLQGKFYEELQVTKEE